MSTRVCIINLSAPEIQIEVLGGSQTENITLRLPWEVGFRQENDGSLVACFGETLQHLNPNHPAEVRFTDLDVRFKDIADERTLACLLNAFFEEIFHRLLPENGCPIEGVSVYTIVPYQWKPVHRRQLRQTLKGLKSHTRVSLLNPSSVTLRCIFSQILCLSAYYQRTWANTNTDTNSCHLFLIDFARSDCVIYQTFCQELEDSVVVQLTDIFQLIDFFSDRNKKVSEVQKAFQKVDEQKSVVVGVSGRINDESAQTFIDSLQEGSSATFLDRQENAGLLGAVGLVQQFEEKSLEKPLHFGYRLCFGVRLPDGKLVQLVPNTWVPPYQTQKAFRVTGNPREFYVHLYCGVSMTENSSVIHLATLEVAPEKNRNYTLSSPMEFVLSVTLNATTHGTFAVHLPQPQESAGVEFAIPVLMD